MAGVGAHDPLLEDGEGGDAHQRRRRPAGAPIAEPHGPAGSHQPDRHSCRGDRGDRHLPGGDVDFADHRAAVAGDHLAGVGDEVGDRRQALSGRQPEDQRLGGEEAEEGGDPQPARPGPDQRQEQNRDDDRAGRELDQRLDRGEGGAEDDEGVEDARLPLLLQQPQRRQHGEQQRLLEQRQDRQQDEGDRGGRQQRQRPVQRPDQPRAEAEVDQRREEEGEHPEVAVEHVLALQEAERPVGEDHVAAELQPALGRHRQPRVPARRRGRAAGGVHPHPPGQQGDQRPPRQGRRPPSGREPPSSFFTVVARPRCRQADGEFGADPGVDRGVQQRVVPRRRRSGGRSGPCRGGRRSPGAAPGGRRWSRP